MTEHLGVIVREGKHGLKLNRNNYIAGSRECSFPWQYGAEYESEELARYIKDCMRSFNLNMEYYAQLCPEEFNAALERFIRENPEFEPVEDLNLYEGQAGYYMMVLDEYRQIYLGTTEDIKGRVRKHWKNVKPLDRLVSGKVENSILAIDSFRALDTTRLFACITEQTYGLENLYIEQLPEKFLCNRTIGGKLKGGLGEAISSRKIRHFG